MFCSHFVMFQFVLICNMLLMTGIVCQKIACSEGTTGPQSPPSSGQQGNVGPPGETGLSGSPGNQGVKGKQGVQGPKGEEGSRGPQGPEGNQGQTGDGGMPGTHGLPGAHGQPGYPGQPGVPLPPVISELPLQNEARRKRTTDAAECLACLRSTYILQKVCVVQTRCMRHTKCGENWAENSKDLHDGMTNKLPKAGNTTRGCVQHAPDDQKSCDGGGIVQVYCCTRDYCNDRPPESRHETCTRLEKDLVIQHLFNLVHKYHSNSCDRSNSLVLLSTIVVLALTLLNF